MKVSLVVIAALFVSPAYAFENLIIDSTFQYPVGLTDKATSWSDVRLTNGPSHLFRSTLPRGGRCGSSGKQLNNRVSSKRRSANLIFLGLRGIEWANLGYEGARKLCIS
jgi:hypothetical protein